ncbi:class I mannose-6-phosphate isomerase [Bifidobacterium sp. ESL0775]|uniref:type I phosphomannose isomerase catalytic subunit n=1 Tax=Bifidobacterium sp. ESL0775 TaxID=2983230 RepID=UPI0023F83AFE|nr:type I phosphomannose isomerase catalytic subunit [Bifidobacterium sp. ESL0775]WEV68960.1 class I mannose-6-phosphate isomerase [Bifidobacterium sp. ESL0775]
MYSIHPVVKRYAWGSYTHLQEMFSSELARQTGPVGEERVDGSARIDSGPIAEMWFSGHAQWPSMVDTGDEEGTVKQPRHKRFMVAAEPDSTLPKTRNTQPGTASMALTDLIRSDPQSMLGARCSGEFGPVLPYLLKVISARIPLSLQVHPVDFRARAGFNAENAERKPINAPDRSFKDPVAKNEMVVALEPFKACVGFASPAFMLANLTLVDHPVASRMVEALTPQSPRGVFEGAQPINSTATDQDFAEADAMMPMASMVWQDSHKRIFRAFHAAVTAGEVPGLHAALKKAASQVSDDRSQLAFSLALAASEAFEDDPSVLALLMMNPLELDEGESVFIPAGTPHAYIHGTGVEVMTNSDDVLRAGMTVKHKDIVNVLKSLDCTPSPPIDPGVNWMGDLGSMFSNRVVYRPRIDEFMLSYGRVGTGRRPWPMVERLTRRYGQLVTLGARYTRHFGPRIVVCLQGSVRVSGTGQGRVLQGGEAVFVPASDGRIQIGPDEGTGSFIVVSTQV